MDDVCVPETSQQVPSTRDRLSSQPCGALHRACARSKATTTDHPCSSDTNGTSTGHSMDPGRVTGTGSGATCARAAATTPATPPTHGTALPAPPSVSRAVAAATDGNASKEGDEAGGCGRGAGAGAQGVGTGKARRRGVPLRIPRRRRRRRTTARVEAAATTSAPPVRRDETVHQRAITRVEASRNFFERLGLEAAPTPVADVRRAYRRLCLLLHPDKNSEAGAVGAFQAVSEAFECLVSASKQAAHLRTLPSGGGGGGGGRRGGGGHRSTSDASGVGKKRRRPGHDGPSWLRRGTRAEFEAKVREELAREAERYKRRRTAKGKRQGKKARKEEAAAKRGGGGAGAGGSGSEADNPEVPVDGVEGAGLEARLASAEGLARVASEARAWKQWKAAQQRQRWSTAGQAGGGVSGAEGAREASVAATQATATATPEPEVGALVCCLLCRRRFPSVAALRLHEQVSKLHLSNVMIRASLLA